MSSSSGTSGADVGTFTVSEIVPYIPGYSAPSELGMSASTSIIRVAGSNACRVDAMNIKAVITAPRSPWHNAYFERVIGSIRRECLDHIVIFNERHLRRVLSSYVDWNL
jgi:transposase InsO family protein